MEVRRIEYAKPNGLKLEGTLDEVKIQVAAFVTEHLKRRAFTNKERTDNWNERISFVQSLQTWSDNIKGGEERAKMFNEAIEYFNSLAKDVSGDNSKVKFYEKLEEDEEFFLEM
jgi:hypothetical protein